MEYYSSYEFLRVHVHLLIEWNGPIYDIFLSVHLIG